MRLHKPLLQIEGSCIAGFGEARPDHVRLAKEINDGLKRLISMMEQYLAICDACENALFGRVLRAAGRRSEGCPSPLRPFAVPL
jgi:hypothetical protein